MDIVALTTDDTLKALLQSCELPTGDLADSDSLFFGIRSDDQLLGCIGLECFSDVALLRSLAVRDDKRRQRLAHHLLNYAERKAQEMQIQTLYLLTSTASGFFARYGYELTDREHAHPAIRNSAQFVGLCPSSASLMVKALI